MAALPLTQICYLILALTGGIVIGSERALAACEVYPSEYAYHKDSVNRAEPASANCRNYLSGHTENVRTENYIHCDGTQLRLTDSDVGSEQYSSSYHYEWSAGPSGIRQLLFIFPTRVNLTTITLHYYSDSQRGLPRLRFYAAPDDFGVWDAPPGNSRYVDIAAVPPGEESAGRRNVSISVNFNTTKILMVKFGSNFKLAVSEVDFFIYNNIVAMTTEPDPPTTTKTSPPMTTEATVASSMSTTSQELDTESDLSSTSSATSVYSQVALTSILVTMATLLLHGPAREQLMQWH